MYPEGDGCYLRGIQPVACYVAKEVDQQIGLLEQEVVRQGMVIDGYKRAVKRYKEKLQDLGIKP